MQKNFDVHYSAGELNAIIQTTLDDWQKENKTQKLWSSDATLWTNQDESKWTGWFDVASDRHAVPCITAMANELKKAGTTDIVLLGMGGSSLCPAMLAETFGKFDLYPQLHILDSTDPEQIIQLKNKINLQKSYFIVSSKSGSTLEPNILKKYFYAEMQIALNQAEVGDRFIAITDPGTTLETLAKDEHFKAIFHGVPSIGGRYSALSNFGMVPFGLMGGDVTTFLNNVEPMHQASSPNGSIKENPGVTLGVILGVCGNHDKDKITLIVSPKIQALGAWLEQLLAESTGKEGKGLIPVDQEPLGVPKVYAKDRVFVYIRLASHPDVSQDKAIDAIEEAGFVVIRLTIADKMHLGAALFLWEIATAVAGSVMAINPFNQPDVEESKVLALQLTSRYEKTRTLDAIQPFYTEDHIALISNDVNIANLSRHLHGEKNFANYVQAFLSLAQSHDYIDIAAFIAECDAYKKLLQDIRVSIRDHQHIATCVGFGPRFLHSTGQAYKGGPNTGLILQITADHHDDLPVPGHAYTFGVVISAQAQADFTVLAKRDRRILRVHFMGEVERGLKLLRDSVRGGL